MVYNNCIYTSSKLRITVKGMFLSVCLFFSSSKVAFIQFVFFMDIGCFFVCFRSILLSTTYNFLWNKNGLDHCSMKEKMVPYGIVAINGLRTIYTGQSNNMMLQDIHPAKDKRERKKRTLCTRNYTGGSSDAYDQIYST